MEKIERGLGLCPVCGKGHIIKTNKDYVCTNKLKPSGNGKSCRFSLPLHLHGVEITDSIIHQLIQNGRTEELTLSDQRGFSYRGHLTIVKDKGYSVETKKITLNAVCPDCGGKIVLTRFGYACENSINVNPTCTFHISNFICNRFISPDEAEAFCNGRGDILDGFYNKQGKWFCAYLSRGSHGEVELTSFVGKCPECGGDILVGTTAFNCSNYKHGCNFKIWKHYYGHKVNLQDAKELLSNGYLQKPFTAFDKYGHILALNLQLGSHNEIQIVSNK